MGRRGWNFVGMLFFERYKGSNKFCFWDLMNIDLISVFRKRVDFQGGLDFLCKNLRKAVIDGNGGEARSNRSRR